mmetsp:Transcript_101612/g.294047  ORF Transcript_101612/g.294047 Transcript_101612/m.294047 type:complete len:239 (+) Transcript_101612:1330-2046(+)
MVHGRSGLGPRRGDTRGGRDMEAPSAGRPAGDSRLELLHRGRPQEQHAAVRHHRLTLPGLRSGEVRQLWLARCATGLGAVRRYDERGQGDAGGVLGPAREEAAREGNGGTGGASYEVVAQGRDGLVACRRRAGCAEAPEPAAVPLDLHHVARRARGRGPHRHLLRHGCAHLGRFLARQNEADVAERPHHCGGPGGQLAVQHNLHVVACVEVRRDGQVDCRWGRARRRRQPMGRRRGGA